MPSIPENLMNTGNYIDQLAKLGVVNPPNGASLSAELAKMANVPRVDTTASITNAAACRTNYTGFGGLRQLQQDQKDMTYYDPRCGWMYNQGSGINPIVNRGVLATPGAQPILGGRGQPDEQRGGTVKMDLRSAELSASAGVANTLGNNCRNLQQLTTANQAYFGFCKTTGKIIPIDTSSGSARARFPNDLNLNCAPANIVPAANAATGCPTSRTEGFNNSINSQLDCKVPLSRDCILRAARDSGCTDKGAVLDALTGSTDPATQYKNINTSKAFDYYLTRNPAQSKMSQIIQNGTGVTSVTDAYDIFNALAQTASEPSTDPKTAGVYSAARDLCLEKGYFYESYNFCSEMNDDTVISTQTIECIQNKWRNAGGSSKGSAYPTINSWNGKKMREFNVSMDEIKANLNNKNKSIQAAAIQKFIGADSSSSVIGVNPVLANDLVMNDNTRGVETTWIYNANGVSIVIRSDMSMARDNETMPLIGSSDDLKYKYQLPATEFISFISLFEYRPPANTTLNLSVTTDDGFMVGYNQNPFERKNNLDWGSWALQGPTTHDSPNPYKIDVTTPSARNNFVVKWFQHQGRSVFQMLMADGSKQFRNVSTDRELQQNMYLTQEPDAPWLQYEVFASSPVIEGGGLAFCEKRFKITDRPFTSVSSFHASMTGGATINTQGDSGTNSGSSNKVIFYTACNFGGRATELPAGNYPCETLYATGYANDSLQSVRVPAGMSVTMWEHQIGSGREVTLTADNPCLTSINYMNTVSSCRVNGEPTTVQQKDVKTGVPGNKGYMSIIPNSSWRTTGKFSRNAFKMLTLLVRPKYSPANDMGTVFTFEGMLSCVIARDGQRYLMAATGGAESWSPPYKECIINEWNLLVIQFVDADGHGIRNIATNCSPLSRLTTKVERQNFMDHLTLRRRNMSATIYYPNPKTAADLNNSGPLVIGNSGNGFNGDVAWLHGFRNYFTSEEMLKTEIESSWISRWESKPTVSGFKDSPSKTMPKSQPKKSEGFFSQFKW